MKTTPPMQQSPAPATEISGPLAAVRIASALSSHVASQRSATMN